MVPCIYLYQHVLRLQSELHQIFWQHYKRAIPSGTHLTPPQALMLCHLAQSSALRIQHVKDQNFYPGTNPSYVIQKLVEQNYVVRASYLHDRRVSLVSLTESGERIAQHCHDFLAQRFKDHPQLDCLLEDVVHDLQKLIAFLPR